MHELQMDRDGAPQNRNLSSSNLRTGDDEGWVALFGKIAPVLSGIGAVGGLINSVISAQKTAEFQQQLVDTLQNMETDLKNIEKDLDAIYQELKNIEQDIEGLGLNDKMNAIDTWSSKMLALESDDEQSAQNLATDMLDASGGAGDLLECMTGIHNAMVGEDIGTPLIELVDAPSFLRLRARLVRGLQLLAFATAFDTREKYDYGVFLLQWSANFQRQLEVYFAAQKDRVSHAIPLKGFADDDALIKSCDTIAVFQYAQPQIPNVALALVQQKPEPFVLYNSELGYTLLPGNTWPILSFVDLPAGVDMCVVDLQNNQATTDMSSPLAKEYNPNDTSGRWWAAYLKVVKSSSSDFLPQCTLASNARYDESQTFLGAVNGQIHWLEAAGDRSTLLSSIHDGTTTDAALVAYDSGSKAAAAKPLNALRSLSEVMWTTSLLAGNAVTIKAMISTDSNPIYLGIDANGNWQVSADADQGAHGVEYAPEAPLTLGVDATPLTMAPTSVTLISAMGGRKEVLFRQL